MILFRRRMVHLGRGIEAKASAENYIEANFEGKF